MLSDGRLEGKNGRNETPRLGRLDLTLVDLYLLRDLGGSPVLSKGKIVVHL